MNYVQHLQYASERLKSANGFAAPDESKARLNKIYAPYGEVYHELTGRGRLEVSCTDTNFERSVRAGIVAARRAIILFGQFGERNGLRALPLVETDATPADDSTHVALLEYAGARIGDFNQASGLFGYDFQFRDNVPAIGVAHADLDIAPAQQEALLSITKKIGVRVIALPLSDRTRASLYVDGSRQRIDF
ncbi:hypothetical protein I8H83_04565 [Candidatus Saccharibacteria bacterium]|nr:hypothetical protein [Candidatus Saccharibacteria bacterium]MBH2007853.1 hypothetical protein [Candidatus Saccharibacteria bacterium]